MGVVPRRLQESVFPNTDTNMVPSQEGRTILPINTAKHAAPRPPATALTVAALPQGSSDNQAATGAHITGETVTAPCPYGQTPGRRPAAIARLEAAVWPQTLESAFKGRRLCFSTAQL